VAENEMLPLEETVAQDELPPELADYSDADVPMGWTVSNLSSADWALSRVADYEREIAENKQLLAEGIARLKLKTDALNAKAAKSVAWFTWQLKRWALQNRPVLLKGGSKKSRALIHGTIGWRKEGGGLEVEDAEKLLAWAQKQPVEFNLVRITEEPAINVIKAWVMEGDGDPAQFPPGMKVGQAKDEFYIRAQSQAPKKEQDNDDAAE
jgi:phage host-nuclease inhibitor protein Gam